MKNQRLRVFGLAFAASLCSLLLWSAPDALAAARTWDGSAANDNFSTATNWSTDVAPVNGDSIVIPYSVVLAGCSGDANLNNDLDSSTVTLAGISFTGSKPASCVADILITGNAIKVSGSILGNDVDDSFPYPKFQVGITATSPVTIQSIRSTAGLAIGTNAVTISGALFGGGVSGSGALTIDGYGSGGKGSGCSPTATPSPFGGDSSSFSGSITLLSSGAMTITKQTTDVARFASAITKQSDGLLSFALDNGQDMSLGTPITFNGGTVSASQEFDADCNVPGSNKTVTLSGDITLTADTTFSLTNVNLKFAGNVTGKDFVKLASGVNGTITFADNSQLTSQLKVWTIDNVSDCSNYDTAANNKVVVNADCSAAIGTDPAFPTEFRGILAGRGKVGHVKILSGGKLAPGESPGCLATGNLTLVSGATYDFEVGGATACTEYDQTRVTGTVDLGSGTLSVSRYNDFKPVKGQVYKIIDNDGADAITGTFANLPEGATFTVDGYVLKISYVGDGNDVTLTVMSVPAVPDTGFALLTANPLITFLSVMMASGGILVIARRYQRQLSAKR